MTTRGEKSQINHKQWGGKKKAVRGQKREKGRLKLVIQVTAKGGGGKKEAVDLQRLSKKPQPREQAERDDTPGGSVKQGKKNNVPPSLYKRGKKRRSRGTE